jgi:hypothetical protein
MDDIPQFHDIAHRKDVKETIKCKDVRNLAIILGGHGFSGMACIVGLEGFLVEGNYLLQ